MLATLRRQVTALQARLKQPQTETRTLLERIRHRPTLILEAAGMTADAWQAKLLQAKWKRALLLCSRQAGKSQVSATLALAEALTRPRSLILLLSPSLRQSGELFRDKLLPLWRAIGRPLMDRPATQLQLELSNSTVSPP